MNSTTWQELSSIVSVLAIVFFAGAWWQATKHNEKTIETIKASFKESVEAMEKNFQGKVSDIKEAFNASIQNIKETIDANTRHTSEQIKQLETKQDKHNNVIERTVAVEASAKSAHKRLDDGEKHFEELSKGIDDIKNFLIEKRIDGRE